MEIRTQPMTPSTRGDTQRHGESDCANTHGCLPACAPLAVPYVPFQRNNPPTYPAKKGTVRGTLFPGLDLPFMGMINTEELPDTPMHELQVLAFAIVELGQYLDTHADDREALELFRSYTQLYQKGLEEYQRMYGPLTQKSSGMKGGYDWLNDPWPWEFEANATPRKEV